MGLLSRKPRRQKTADDRMGEALLTVFGIAAAAVGTAGFVAFHPYLTQDTVRATVTEKTAAGDFYIVTQRKDGKTGKTVHETFENEQEVHFLKFNSAAVQRSVEVGKTYDFRVYGFGSETLGWQRNIIRATPVVSYKPVRG